MISRELLEQIKNGLRPIIEIINNDLDEGPDVGMKALIQSAREAEDDCIEFTLLFDEYREYNNQFEIKNWYDKNGKPTLGWSESPHYNEGVYHKWLGSDEDIQNSFRLVTASNFFNLYKESNSSLTYVSWLEEELTKALK